MSLRTKQSGCRRRASLLLALSTCLAATATQALEIPAPKTAPEVTVPSDQVLMHPEYAKTIGRMAYVWGWPMVNMINRRTTITQVPEPGRLNSVLPVAPRGRVGMLSDYIDPGQTFVTCPNQDVVYGLGFFSLDEEPVVAEVPDFGDRFWVYAMYDARTDQVAEIGKPYGTKPGFYLIAGTKSPGKDKESNRLPAPEGPFSLYIRAYWGKEGIVDGTWQPPVIRAVH